MKNIIHKLRVWLINKLGGYFLDQDDAEILRAHRVKKMFKAIDKQMDIDMANWFMAGFNTTYTDADKIAPVFGSDALKTPFTKGSFVCKKRLSPKRGIFRLSTTKRKKHEKL